MTAIKTTHVGSLPRSAAVTEVVFAAERDEPVDPAVFEATIAEAVEEVVARQVAAGVDVVSDGEMSKISYATYIKDRISGFAGDSPRRAPADLEAFPSFLQRQANSSVSTLCESAIREISAFQDDNLADDITILALRRITEDKPGLFSEILKPRA